MVGLARVELATLGLGNQCSIHLSYSPLWVILTSLLPLSPSKTTTGFVINFADSLTKARERDIVGFIPTSVD
jgi:hypothetical protein